MKNFKNHNVDLTNRYKSIRDFTIDLVKTLTPEDMNIQSQSFVSPTKWHLAHTTWFFEKFILEKYKKNFKPYNKVFNFLFNSYYNSIGKQFPQKSRGQLSRPSIGEIFRYRTLIDEQIIEIIENNKKNENLMYFLDIGINHEQQHQELILMDILNVFYHNPLKPKFSNINRKFEVIKKNSNSWTYNEKSLNFKIGCEDDGFCFDNELPVFETTIKPFKISKNLVNNLQWKEFIYDDGYKRPELWLSDGYDYIKKNSINKPLYWLEDNFMFSLNGLKKISDLDPVCHISFYEADAFARWKKKRLPSEFELEYLLKKQVCNGNFLEDKKFEPIFSSFGSDEVEQIYGDVWEWTRTNYLPYEGFNSWRGAAGEYNEKFMCNQFVLKGGSCVTPRSHIRSSYRNFYYPYDRWQFSGLRLSQ